MKIQKCSMMPRWHHSDSSKVMSTEHDSVKKKTLELNSRSNLFSAGLFQKKKFSNLFSHRIDRTYPTSKRVWYLSVTCCVICLSIYVVLIVNTCSSIPFMFTLNGIITPTKIVFFFQSYFHNTESIFKKSIQKNTTNFCIIFNIFKKLYFFCNVLDKTLNFSLQPHCKYVSIPLTAMLYLLRICILKYL